MKTALRGMCCVAPKTSNAPLARGVKRNSVAACETVLLSCGCRPNQGEQLHLKFTAKYADQPQNARAEKGEAGGFGRGRDVADIEGVECPMTVILVASDVPERARGPA